MCLLAERVKHVLESNGDARAPLDALGLSARHDRADDVDLGGEVTSSCDDDGVSRDADTGRPVLRHRRLWRAARGGSGDAPS